RLRAGPDGLSDGCGEEPDGERVIPARSASEWVRHSCLTKEEYVLRAATARIASRHTSLSSTVELFGFLVGQECLTYSRCSRCVLVLPPVRMEYNQRSPFLPIAETKTCN
ncbi:MAG: hypothetical protein WD030_09305, partial [Pirellulales bacterium]